MPNIFREFDAILAKLNISDIRPYMKKYNNTESKRFNRELKSLEDGIINIKPIIDQIIQDVQDNDDEDYMIINILSQDTNESDAFLNKCESAVCTSIHNIVRQFLHKEYDFDWNKHWDEDSFIKENIIDAGVDTFEGFKKKIIQEILNNTDKIKQDTEGRIAEEIKYRRKNAWKHKDETNYLKHVYDKIFGKKDRIILPKKINSAVLEGNKGSNNSDKYRFAASFLNVLYHYFEAIKNKEAEAVLAEISNTKPSSFVDYLGKGFYEFKTMERSMKIGKLLTSAESKLSEPKYVMAIRDLKKAFLSRETIKEPLIIIVSRHPYDMAGMSTGRGWTSCMNLYNGCYNDYVETSIMGGGLIAYLCKKDDTNINDPLGRILIKTYVNNEDYEINFEEPNFVLRCSKAYGTFYNELIQYVQDWLDEVWNNEVLERNAGYSYNLSNNFYKESDDEENYYA